MNDYETDILIVGAGPVGLMCAYLSQICSLQTVIIDQSEGPLKLGRADALNARTLQFFELADLFSEIYPQGKTCNTSSVWQNGKFISRQSSWWDELEGCFHRHFLMIGQAQVEKLLDDRLTKAGTGVIRSTSVKNIEPDEKGCLVTLSDQTRVRSKFVIGADGSRSFVRNHFKIPFDVIRPEIVWAVIDGVIETDFPKVPEIIVFQTDSSDVAWIPREGDIDRFYVRIDSKNFNSEEIVEKINRAMKPHVLKFKEIIWSSVFSVKESVADKFYVHDRIFLAGDACHIHSVNGGQGLNTGLADAFNLVWKLNMVLNFGASRNILKTYESERKPVAQSVIETAGELVRSTKDSPTGTHAKDYVGIVRKRAGNITGMGIRYGDQGPCGSRLFDFELYVDTHKTRIYTVLDYSKFTLLVFGDFNLSTDIPEFVKMIQIFPLQTQKAYRTDFSLYKHQAILVRPDAYIESYTPVETIDSLFKLTDDLLCTKP